MVDKTPMPEWRCKCGTTNTTQYCPDCGAQSEHPLAGLLCHINATIDSKRKAVSRAAGEIEDLRAGGVRHLLGQTADQAIRRRLRMNERAEAVIAKWAAWRDALMDVVADEE